MYIYKKNIAIRHTLDTQIKLVYAMGNLKPIK